MSFTNTTTSNPSATIPGFKKFVSEDELEEKRKQRQEEWEKVRTAEDPEEAPEEEYDPRSLYERLQAQKDMKQQEYDETHKLKNQVKGLESDEVEFLDYVSKRQMELENKRLNEDEAVLSEFRSAVSSQIVSSTDNKVVSSKPSSSGSSAVSGKNSQKNLLSSIVKRKSESKNEAVNKKIKSEENIVEKADIEPNEKQNCDRKVLAILPGIGEYTDSSADDTDHSSSESDGELGGLGLMSNNSKIVVETQNGQKVVVNSSQCTVHQH